MNWKLTLQVPVVLRQAPSTPMAALSSSELRAICGGPMTNPTSGIPVPPAGAKS